MSKVIKAVGSAIATPVLTAVGTLVGGPLGGRVGMMLGGALSSALLSSKPGSRVPQSRTQLGRLEARLDTQAPRTMVLGTSAMRADVRFAT